MQRIRTLLLTAVIVFCVCMTACGGGNDIAVDQVAGTWVRTMSDGTDTITFNKDMTYDKTIALTSAPPVTTNTSGTYSLSGDTISIFYSEYGTSSDYTVTFSGNKMTWDNGNTTLEYVKQ